MKSFFADIDSSIACERFQIGTYMLTILPSTADEFVGGGDTYVDDLGRL